MKDYQTLPDELLDFNYYLEKIPLYLRNDDNFVSHFKIWYDFMIYSIKSQNKVYVDSFIFSTGIYSDTSLKSTPKANVGDLLIGKSGGIGLINNIELTRVLQVGTNIWYTYTYYYEYLGHSLNDIDYKLKNKTLIPVESQILKLINIFDDNYINLLNLVKQSNGEIREYKDNTQYKVGDKVKYNNKFYECIANTIGDFNSDKWKEITSDILDKLGSIFNIYRNFSVNVNENNILINLNDEEFLLFIKAQIIKNYSDGSFEQMNEFYIKAGLLVAFEQVDSPASINVRLIEINNSNYSYSDNIKNLFLAGLLTIESMGIQYTFTVTNMQKMFIWDTPDGTNIDSEGNLIEVHTWDKGVWDV